MKGRGHGLREWQKSLTPEQREEYARKGGLVRGRKLSKKRRQEISEKASAVWSAMAQAKKQANSGR